MENKGNAGKKYELKQIEVRLKVKESDPIYSSKPIDCAEKAVKLLSDFMRKMDREYVYILNCDTKMRPLSYSMVAMGGMNYAPIDPANIFKTALLSNAANIMIMHVHPSGDNTPSRMDMEATRRLAEAGSMMGIPVQDHLVVAAGTGEFYSMRLNMPELFSRQEDRAYVEWRAEIPLVNEPAAAIDNQVYNKVITFLGRQQELMQNSPEAWDTAKEIAILSFEVKGQEMDARDYETQKYIVETAEKIRDNDTDGLKVYLADLGERVTDIEQAKRAFSLIVKVSSYGEWETASREAEMAFEKENNTMAGVEKTALADREASQAISFSQKLEEKSREAEGINAARAMDRQQVISPQERQAI